MGSSRPSQTVTVQTEGGVPLYTGSGLSPSGAVMANTSWALVSTAGWRDQGCPISHYSVAYRRTAHTTWLVGEWLLLGRKLGET